MKIILLCLLNTTLMVAGQILFKLGSDGRKIETVMDIIGLFFTPVIFCALCIYAATTGLWLYILSRTAISRAYPIQALAYPLVLLASAVIFREQVSPAKWLGVFIIICGVTIATHG